MRFSNLIGITGFALVAACASHVSREAMAEMSGAEIYQQLCTSCHGARGKGDGPMAPMLKIEVADLTRLSQRHAGEFPAEQVRSTIDGRSERPAHGLPYMPVWGLRFYDPEKPDDAQARARGDSIIERLVGYLQSIQEE